MLPENLNRMADFDMGERIERVLLSVSSHL